MIILTKEHTMTCEECQGELCPYNINLLPNEKLTKKLLERNTFVGVIVSSEDVPHSTEFQNFTVSFNDQLDTKEVANILHWAANALLETANKQ